MASKIDQAGLPRVFGPYQLLRRIAVGGMAEVYVAVARGVGGFEKLVALKLIHPEHSEDDSFIRMLVDEAKLTVLLTHANIAQTFDLGCIEGRYCIVLEYVDGLDLSKLLERVAARRALLPVEAGLFIVNRVCQALDYAHRKTDLVGKSLNVIHRDISPQNVLLGREGDVKLTDFGIAKAALRSSETEVGVIKGKYCYMSPEQAWADPIDQRSDLFSAGAVLYELLTGRMLFSPDENLPALLERVRHADYVPPTVLRPDLPGEVDAIVRRALAKKPDDRYETAADMAFDLERQLWYLDRGWGPGKLKKLMDEYVGTEPMVVPGGPTGRTAVTKIEGQIGKMDSKQFVPETSTSILFSPTDRATERPGRTSKNPAPPRGVVERPSHRPDPRRDDDRPSDPKPADDEEEATTFFQKGAFDFGGPPSDLVALVASAGDEESTLVDTGGNIAQQLVEMVSLGGARPQVAPTFEEPAVVKPFVPPPPLWPSLPFVGPPLEPEAVEAPKGVAIDLNRAAIVASLLVIVALAVAIALRG